MGRVGLLGTVGRECRDVPVAPPIMPRMTPVQQRKLTRFAELVTTSPHNLVSRRARAEVLSRHVPESVAFARGVPSAAERLIDVGSGGGFPGVVIAILRPDLAVHLVESSSKKAQFLGEVSEELAVPFTVHDARAEELARGPLGGTFDVATARAVAPLEALLPLTIPFLNAGGLLMAIKGARWVQEVEAARRRFAKWQVELVSIPEADAGDPAPGDAPRVVTLRHRSAVAR